MAARPIGLGDAEAINGLYAEVGMVTAPPRSWRPTSRQRLFAGPPPDGYDAYIDA